MVNQPIAHKWGKFHTRCNNIGRFVVVEVYHTRHGRNSRMIGLSHKTEETANAAITRLVGSLEAERTAKEAI